MAIKGGLHNSGLSKARADTLYIPVTLTTKGDLLVYDGSSYQRLPVGTDAFVLTADSAQSLGIKWAAASGGSGGGSVTQADVQVPTQRSWFFFGV